MLNESYFSKDQKIGIILIMTLIITVMFVHPCLADNPFEVVSSALEQVYDSLRAISTGIAVVGAVCALLVRMFAKNPQAKAQSTAWLIGIVVAWIAIQSLGTILNWLAGMFPETSAAW